MSTRGKFPIRYLTSSSQLHPEALSPKPISSKNHHILPRPSIINSSIPLTNRHKPKCVRLSALTVSGRDHLPLLRHALHRMVLWAVSLATMDILTVSVFSRPGWLPNSQLLLGGMFLHRSPPRVIRRRQSSHWMDLSFQSPPSRAGRFHGLFTRRWTALRFNETNLKQPCSFTALNMASRYGTSR